MRGRLILLGAICVLASLPGAGVALAHSAKHRSHHRHRHHAVAHRTSVLPPMGALPSPSLFGINAFGWDNNPSLVARSLPTAHGIGARWVHFNGGVTFGAGGQPNWSILDSEITRARRLGEGVLVTLGGSPSSCSVSPRPWTYMACPPRTPGELYAYSLFLQQELVRYRNVVQYYESWLEPDNKAYWEPGVDPLQYANLLRTQYQVFQQVNATYHTDLKLLFGGPISFSTVPGDGYAVLPFVHDVLDDLGGVRAFDGAAIHAYRFPAHSNGPAGENWGPTAVDWDYVDGLSFRAEGCVAAQWCKLDWRQELWAYEQQFENHGYGQTPLWLTEFGWPGNATASDALYPSFDTQASYLSEAYSELLGMPFVQGAFVFNLRDYEPGVSSSDPQFFYHYGLLQYGYAPKPAAAVFERFAQSNPGR